MKVLVTSTPVVVQGQEENSLFFCGTFPGHTEPLLVWKEASKESYTTGTLFDGFEEFVPDITRLWSFTPERVGDKWFWKPSLVRAIPEIEA